MSEDAQKDVFYPKRSTAILLLVVCSAFVALGIGLGRTEGWFGFLCAAFFALGIPVAIVQMLPGSAFLEVDATGLTFAHWYRKTHIPWNIVDHFSVVVMTQHDVTTNEMVGITFVPSYDRARLARRVTRAMMNCEGALPDTYGKKACDLADYLSLRLAEYNATQGVSQIARS